MATAAEGVAAAVAARKEGRATARPLLRQQRARIAELEQQLSDASLHIAAAIAEDVSSPPPSSAASASSPPPRAASASSPPPRDSTPLEGADEISESDARLIFYAQFPNAEDFSIEEIKQFLAFNY